MKVALVVNRVTGNINMNIANIVDAIHKCADNDVNLVLFPEAAITGLINNDNFSHDLPLGVEIPGKFTNKLTEIATGRNIQIAIGLLEREKNKLYDSAILITPEQGIVIKYRRITPGWHGKNADERIYCQGNDVKKADNSFGSFAFLICGDLFSDELCFKIRMLHPDWLLFPFARSFEDGSYSQEKWDKEKYEYIKRVKLMKVTTFMVNYLGNKELDDDCFGGAMAVSPSGEIISEMPIGREGILYVEI